MKMRFPWNFCPGIEYRYLSIKEGRGVYRFETLRKTVIPLHFDHPDMRVVDADGTEWVRLDGNVMTIRAGYAWNGCSPKKGWCGIWWGTPDFTGSRRASLAHDALFQISGTKHFRATMQQCNEVFYRLMLRDGFWGAPIYFEAVQRFGRKFFGKADLNLRSEVI